MEIEIKTVERKWKDIKEKSYNATSFSIKGRKGEIYVTEDADYPNSHNVHMILGEELNDKEIRFLVSSVIKHIPESHYILSCGEAWEQKERMYRIFESLLPDTGCLRTLRDHDGKEHYYKILKKL
jgi:hypothetical protein